MAVSLAKQNAVLKKLIVALLGLGLATHSAAFQAAPPRLRTPLGCARSICALCGRPENAGHGAVFAVACLTPGERMARCSLSGGQARGIQINLRGCRRQKRGCVGLAAAGAGARKGGEKRGQSGETLGARAYEDGRGTLPRPWSDELDRRILRVLLPCSLSFLVVPLTNAVDAAWIGRMGDALALAGQGAANQVFSTAFFLISFLPTVMAPLVARAVGKKDEDDARARIGETLFLATFFGVLGTIALSVYPGVCMRIVLPDDAGASAHANSYLWVRSLSLLPALWGSVGFAALRGAQDTTTPLKISAASNLFNAIVDPILIFACSLGVTGAAVATALAEAGAGVAYLLVLSRRRLLSLRSAVSRVPPWHRLRPLLAAGATLQFRNMCLNFAFVFASRTAQLGDASGVQGAAYSITMLWWGLGGVLLSALQASAATLVPSERASAEAAARDAAVKGGRRGQDSGEAADGDGGGQEARGTTAREWGAGGRGQDGVEADGDWGGGGIGVVSEGAEEGMMAARRVSDRLMGWGVVFGVVLALVQVRMSSPLKSTT